MPALPLHLFRILSFSLPILLSRPASFDSAFVARFFYPASSPDLSMRGWAGQANAAAASQTKERNTQRNNAKMAPAHKAPPRRCQRVRAPTSHCVRVSRRWQTACRALLLWCWSFDCRHRRRSSSDSSSSRRCRIPSPPLRTFGTRSKRAQRAGRAGELRNAPAPNS